MTKTLPCRCCNGSGAEIDQKALGQEMRGLREKAGLTLKEIGSRLKPTLSDGYLSELERGSRNWKPEVVAQYRRVCK